MCLFFHITKPNRKFPRENQLENAENIPAEFFFSRSKIYLFSEHKGKTREVKLFPGSCLPEREFKFWTWCLKPKQTVSVVWMLRSLGFPTKHNIDWRVSISRHQVELCAEAGMPVKSVSPYAKLSCSEKNSQGGSFDFGLLILSVLLLMPNWFEESFVENIEKWKFSGKLIQGKTEIDHVFFFATAWKIKATRNTVWKRMFVLFIKNTTIKGIVNIKM